MKSKLAFAIWSAALLASPVIAQEVRFDSVPAELVPRYETQKADIEALVAKIGNKDLSGDDRAAQLNELQLRYPYVSLPVASSVILQDSAPLQLAATSILANSVVMMNHAGDDHAMRQTDATMALLKQVVETGTSEARNLAAQVGASLGDPSILGEIEDQNSKGSLSDTEAVSYFTLAEPELAATYVSKYLKSDSVPAQKQAVAYLGPLPEYQNTIRQDYLFDTSKPTELQAAAARVLARTDNDFMTYSDKVIKRGGTPVEVVDAIIRGSIENKSNPVNAEQVLKYRAILDDYEKANPGIDVQDLNAIQKQIQILQ